MELQLYINKLSSTEPDITSIWLIGSRANGTENACSDWDFIVFGNEKVISSIAKNKSLHHPKVDLLVVFDGDNFETAWGKEKSGSLSKWEWQLTSNSSAKYRGTKADPGSIFINSIECQARRVYGS